MTNTHDDMVSRALHEVEAGRPRQALLWADRALADDPTSTQAHVLAAGCAHAIQEHERALVHVEFVLSHEPDDPDCLDLLASIHTHLGSPELAEGAILRALELDPTNAEYHSTYAVMCIDAYQLDKARALTDIALELDPLDVSALFLDLVLKLIENQNHEISDEIASLLARDGSNSIALRTLVLASIARQDYEEAHVLLQALLREDPYDEDLLAMVVETRARTHWSLLPARPFFGERGMVAALVFWGIATTSTYAAMVWGQIDLGLTASLCFAVFVVYTWTWPRILPKILLRTGL